MKMSKIIVFCGLFAMLILTLMASAVEKIYASEKPIVVRWSFPSPPRGPRHARKVAGVKKIQEMTGGRVVFELYGGGALCRPKETLEALRSGVANFATINPSYTPGLFPRAQIAEIPGLSTDAISIFKALKEVSQKYLGPEYEKQGIKFLHIYPLPMSKVFSKKQLPTVDDFKGVKISCAAEVLASYLKRLGFAPVVIPGAETYLALQKGVIDAAIQAWLTARISRYEEVVNYANLLSIPGIVISHAWNMDFYNNLPPDIRKLLDEELIKYLDENHMYKGAEEDNQARQYLMGKGIKEVHLVKSELKRAKQMSPGIESWIAKEEKRGNKDAKEYAEAFLKALRKYESE